ncbi:hypothetical protein ACLKA7_000925 [Drosophila subpalustris]
MLGRVLRTVRGSNWILHSAESCVFLSRGHRSRARLSRSHRAHPGVSRTIYALWAEGIGLAAKFQHTNRGLIDASSTSSGGGSGSPGGNSTSLTDGLTPCE